MVQMQTISNAFNVNRIKDPNRISPFTCDCEQRWALREAIPPPKGASFCDRSNCTIGKESQRVLTIQLTFLLQIIIFIIESSIGYAEKLVELNFAIKSHSLSKSERVRTC